MCRVEILDVDVDVMALCVCVWRMCITRPRMGVLDVCVSAMRLAGGAFALGAFALGAFALGVFALGAFVVHLLSETPKSTDGGCVAWVCVITQRPRAGLLELCVRAIGFK